VIYGVRIEGSKKVYYYKSNAIYRIGQNIMMKAPNGGHFDAVIVSVSSKSAGYDLKELREVR